LSDIYAILKEAGFEATIGLEVHVQLNTATKIFSSDENGMSEEPNSHISAISLGLPGSLPVLNKNAVEKAIQFGLAVGSQINSKICFDRKSYFYPDLPKGYQTTQDKAPICLGGIVEAYSEYWKGETVQVHHTHLEEDAGKSSHDGEFTDVDLNRAGSPLIEIVTEPCIKSGKVAAAFLQEIRRIVRFLNIGEANMERGELRCDANISIKRIESEILGSKVEIKNMNSFSHVRKAVDFELERQFGLINAGETVTVETRTYDPDKAATFGMRFKETLNDYRYFPCPDLPPVLIPKEEIDQVKSVLKPFPSQVRKTLRSKYDLPEADIAFLCADIETAEFALALFEVSKDFKKANNWMKGIVRAHCVSQNIGIHEFPRSINDLAQLINMETEGDLTRVAAQEVFIAFVDSDLTANQIAEAKGLLSKNDQGELERIVSEVLLSLPQEVEKYQKGKKQLFGLFMGEVMKKGGKSLNPKQIQEVLRKELSK